MNGPPPDDSTPPTDDGGRDAASPPDAGRDTRHRGGRSDAAADRAGGSSGDGAVGDHGGSDAPDAGRSEFDDPLGDLLPRAPVDSRWWYWIAAIPLYVLFGAVFGVLFVGIALLGLGFGVEGGLVGFGLFFVLVVVLGLAGLVLTVLFPIATYVDARAIAASEAPWTPDPLVWGLAALATVVLSAFTLSFVLAVYYLYKRHVAVRTP
ncbi:hypothetical protein [Halobellus ruber]|uniref:Uncharacterized protein n=1 Tax=Halobellus ruber TaxID=2761102 RepID=A0A7J9SK62_9EURY|nr:hypothetical protein [Halobellus ruber]MBB6647305.1 hypothetical protein [Halobellus ruber]